MKNNWAFFFFHCKMSSNLWILLDRNQNHKCVSNPYYLSSPLFFAPLPCFGGVLCGSLGCFFLSFLIANCSQENKDSNSTPHLQERGKRVKKWSRQFIDDEFLCWSHHNASFLRCPMCHHSVPPRHSLFRTDLFHFQKWLNRLYGIFTERVFCSNLTWLVEIFFSNEWFSE